MQCRCPTRVVEVVVKGMDTLFKDVEVAKVVKGCHQQLNLIQPRAMRKGPQRLGAFGRFRRTALSIPIVGLAKACSEFCRYSSQERRSGHAQTAVQQEQSRNR